MKTIRLSCLLALAFFSLVRPLPGAESDALKDMPPAYIATLKEAMRLFSARDFKGALGFIDKAETMHAPTALTLNVRGAVEIEEKRFAEGRELLLKALQVDPQFFPSLFNLAEIPFMQGKYAEARLAYEKLVDDETSAELVRFRIFLTYLLEKNDERAKEMLDQIPLLNDTPIYFYANAAWHFAHANKKEALSYLKSAEAVFPAGKLSNFADVFYDLGWLQRATPTP